MVVEASHGLLCEPETVAQLASDYYGGTFEASSLRVREACAKASARFRGAIRHKLTVETNKQLILDGTGTCYLRLPVLYPVIDSVTVNGTTVTPVGVSPNGMLEFAAPLPRRLGAVLVSLARCGLDVVPDDVLAAVTTEALMHIGRTPGVQSEQVGAVQVSYGATGVVGIREEWEAAVENYRINIGDRA